MKKIAFLSPNIVIRIGKPKLQTGNPQFIRLWRLSSITFDRGYALYGFCWCKTTNLNRLRNGPRMDDFVYGYTRIVGDKCGVNIIGSSKWTESSGARLLLGLAVSSTRHMGFGTRARTQGKTTHFLSLGSHPQLRCASPAQRKPTTSKISACSEHDAFSLQLELVEARAPLGSH